MTGILELIGSAAIVGFVLMILGKLLPNDKLRAWGYKCGVGLTKFGNLKFGSAYEKIESFVQNSMGVFFEGLGSGLNNDDLIEEPKEENVESRL